ncbi:hypothetical protein DSM112329_00294 [Paraconexibacter sp. AEG42_29]|uniref:Aminoglycoside phosphotransferase domain-containing protein n=1 Tax=Paraconexibacter sp. AEG42_29 TaxID=2997339 RepID=A0AAU7APF2_9ACTN
MSGEHHDTIAALLAQSLGADVTVTGTERVTGGYSRVMRRITAEVDGEPRTFVWRADPPEGEAIVSTDRAREYGVLAALGGAGGAPAVHAFDPDGSRLGAVGMIIDYVDGTPLHAVLSATDEREWPGHVRSIAELAARIHATDVADVTAVLGEVPSWADHIDSCVAQWRALADGQVEPAPLMRYVAEWLDVNRPPEVPLCLLHGDLETPNIIVEGDSVSAIDWEFTRIGDPREDLGYFAALSAISPPDPIAGDLTALCAAYREASGLSEAQLNPLTVSYFSILPFGPMVAQFVGQVTDLVAGTNRSLKTANLAYVVTAMAEGWVGVTRQLDAAKAAAGVPTT